MRFTRRTWAASLLMGALVGLSACAVQPEQLSPGMPRAEVLQTLGKPTASYPASGGERLQYSMQPAGQRVYNVDLDARGALLGAEQALSESLFAQRIVPDRWTTQDILFEYGPPARIQGVHNFKGRIWVWRYANGPVWRLLFIDVDPDGVVRGYSVGDEPMPEPFDPPR